MTKWEIHDGGRVGQFGDLGPTICAVNPDGTCQPLFEVVGPADPDVCRRNLALAAAAPATEAACRLFEKYDNDDASQPTSIVTWNVLKATIRAALTLTETK